VTTRAQARLIAQFQRNARLAAERIERSPWTLGIRAARAEAELTGSREVFDDLVRRYAKPSAGPDEAMCRYFSAKLPK
jgi:hypothetical protein